MQKNVFICFQVKTIKEHKKAHPHDRFWIKADACDIKVALQEFVKGKWDGGVDLGDKKLKGLQNEYDPHKVDTCIQEDTGTK